MKKALTCVGTRPNLIKITQLEKNFRNYPEIEHKLLHTGQHFDYNMSEVFFKELGIKPPDVFLHVNQGSQIEVIAEIMKKMERFLLEYQPDLVLVPGDVNSSFACAFAASRLNIPVAHIESGLRSFDRNMPEEVNRVLVDAIADLLFVTEKSGLENLKTEGKKSTQIKFTGNTMIDSLVAFQSHIDKCAVRKKLGIEKDDYTLLTFHRPSNVDDKNKLTEIVSLLEKISVQSKAVFPVHPRTLKNLKNFGLFGKLEKNASIILTEPLGYLDFLHLLKNCKMVLTDSGGIQEESTFLKIPCLTVRENTERPVTIEVGTNTLVELDVKTILVFAEKILNGEYKTGKIPELWDGKASERLVKHVNDFLFK